MTTWQRIRDPEAVAFTTPDVQRVFLACMQCQRVKPHYDIYADLSDTAKPRCRCGHHTFRPRRISELNAAWRVLVVGWLWRKVIRRKVQWDPRLPIRQA